MIHTAKPPIEICELLPPQARMALVDAGRAKNMAAINSAHRYARAAHPQFFDMGDDSYSTKTPRQADEE
jgi:hypothetical protein